MIKGTCIEIHTKKFPILDGEDDELINEGMYGKALCTYLNSELPKVGVNVPTYLCEDFGWWLEVENGDFSMALLIYSDSRPQENPEKYAIMSSVQNEKKWVWSKFKHIDLTDDVLNLIEKVEKIFREDPEIAFVKRHDDFPF